MQPLIAGPRRATTRSALGLVGVITLAFAASACGSATTPKSDDVASLGTVVTDDSTSGTGDGTNTTTPASVDPQDAFVAYTECMRDNGIDMPDPQLATSTKGAGGPVAGAGPVVVAAGPLGGDSNGSGSGPAFDPTSDDFKDADKVCQPLLADVTNDIDIDPEVEAEHRQQMLDFSKCMREHGIDMPDPTFSDNGGISISVSGADADSDEPAPDSDAFQAANEACAALLGDDAPMIATGPATAGES